MKIFCDFKEEVHVIPTESAGENMTNGAIKALKDSRNKEEITESASAVTKGFVDGIASTDTVKSIVNYPTLNAMAVFAFAGGMKASTEFMKAFATGAKGRSAAQRAAGGVVAALATIHTTSSVKEMDMAKKAAAEIKNNESEEARILVGSNMSNAQAAPQSGLNRF